VRGPYDYCDGEDVGGFIQRLPSPEGYLRKRVALQAGGGRTVIAAHDGWYNCCDVYVAGADGVWLLATFTLEVEIEGVWHALDRKTGAEAMADNPATATGVSALLLFSVRGHLAASWRVVAETAAASGVSAQADVRMVLWNASGLTPPLPPRRYNSGGLLTNQVIATTTARLIDIWAFNAAAATRFLQLFDLIALPVDTTVPEISAIPVPPGGVAAYTFGEESAQAFTRGLVWCSSTTQATKTITLAADLNVSARWRSP
jgi:hypothetical protein